MVKDIRILPKRVNEIQNIQSTKTKTKWMFPTRKKMQLIWKMRPLGQAKIEIESYQALSRREL